jgi:hypothetical protein
MKRIDMAKKRHTPSKQEFPLASMACVDFHEISKRQDHSTTQSHCGMRGFSDLNIQEDTGQNELTLVKLS